MTDEYYIEGLCPRRKKEGFRLAWMPEPERSSHVWRRLHKKPIPHHDFVVGWIRKNAAEVVQAKALALRVIKVISWHQMELSIGLPLSNPESVQELVPKPNPQVFRDDVPGDEWKFDAEDDDSE